MIRPVPEGYTSWLNPPLFAGWFGLFITALNLLPMVEPPRDSEQQQALMRTLQRSLPELRSIALLAPSGALISDSASDSQDAAWLEELVQRSHSQPYYLSNSSDGTIIYLLLHQPSGGSRVYWALRLAPNYLVNLTRQDSQGQRPMWAIENRLNHRVVSRDSGMPAQWGDALRQTALMLGTGTDHPVPMVADAGDAALIRYTQYLPLPV